MMEKRLRSVDGGNCTIANMKAQLGQLQAALKETKQKLAALQGGSREECQEEGTLQATEAEEPGICEDDPEGSEMLNLKCLHSYLNHHHS